MLISTSTLGVRKHGRGSASLLVMLSTLPLLTMLGLVMDVGWAYFTRESAQAAAEAAAIAAAQSAIDGVTAGGTYTCGSYGLGCQSATACPTTITTPTTGNLQNGCAYAIANGFTNGGLSGTQTVTIAANITSPAPTVPGVVVSYWATVYITQQNPLTFLAVLGGTSVNVAVRATAGVIAAAQQNCLVFLDPSGNHSLTISGGAQVNATACGTEVDSNSSDALDVSGGSSLISSSVQIVGNYNDHGCATCISPAPVTGVNPFSDPLAALSPPTYAASNCDYTNEKVSGGTVTLSAGNYCGGITIQGGATVTFNSGTYVLLGGGFTISGGSTVTGSGVTFYNTYNAGNPNNYKAVNISSSTVTLSAPSSGPLTGILFFQDRTANSNGQETFSGGSNLNLNGTLYFPVSKTQVVFSGGSGGSNSNTTIVAFDMTFSGNSYLGSSAAGGSSGPSKPTAALIE